MRKLCFIIPLVLLLCGCKQTQTYETVIDQMDVSNKKDKMVIMVDIPENAAMQTMESSSDCKVYICDDYSLTTATVDGGDLQKTIMGATGFLPEQLDLIQTQQGECKRYVCVWTAAGENGEQVGRCAVLDDGSYHYVLTAMADAKIAGSLAENDWQSIFRSFRLISADDVVSSGS